MSSSWLLLLLCDFLNVLCNFLLTEQSHLCYCSLKTRSFLRHWPLISSWKYWMIVENLPAVFYNFIIWQLSVHCWYSIGLGSSFSGVISNMFYCISIFFSSAIFLFHTLHVLNLLKLHHNHFKAWFIHLILVQEKIMKF